MFSKHENGFKLSDPDSTFYDSHERFDFHCCDCGISAMGDIEPNFRYLGEDNDDSYLFEVESFSAESFKAENRFNAQMENIYLVALGMAHQEILNGGERATMEIWFEGRPVMLAIDNAAGYFAINPKVLQSRYDSHNFVEPDWRDEYHQALSALKEAFPSWSMFTPKGEKRFDL